MQSRKTIFLLMIIPLMGMVAFSQNFLNKQRGELSVAYLEPLRNADPLVKFTSEALGGFRGVIATALWMRINNLQLEGKFLEMVQLSEWITKLQPHTPTVWTDRAWNLAYNVSVKETDVEKRYKWVMAGISLLRDEAIQYNPHEPLLYWELAWQFKHKMGQDMDSAHRIYKRKWINEMTTNIWPSVKACVESEGRPDWDSLLNPKTDEEKARVRRLIRDYKLNPRKMKAVDDQFGTVEVMNTKGEVVKDENGDPVTRQIGLEWRLPETQAIYWAYMGIQKSRENTARREMVKKLRRVIFQSMSLSCGRGRLMVNPFTPNLERAYLRGVAMRYGPRLDFIPQVDKEYVVALEEARKNQYLHPGGIDTISTYRTAHHNFLRQATRDLYMYNRVEESQYWFKKLVNLYPDKVRWYIGYDTETKTMDWEVFVMSELEDDFKRSGRDTMNTLLMGLISTAYYYLAMGEDDQALGQIRMSQQFIAYYNERRKDSDTSSAGGRVDLDSWKNLHDQALKDVFVGMDKANPEMAAALRERLGLKSNEVPQPGLPDLMNPYRTKESDRATDGDIPDS